MWAISIMCAMMLLAVVTAAPVPVLQQVASFQSAFGEAFAVILATEIGDKTFFIAAVMAMRHSRFVTWSGAVAALVVMTVLSTAVGHVAPLIIPGSRIYTHYAAAGLFLLFGVRMLREGFHADSGASDELEEVELELAKKQEQGEDGEDELASRSVLLQAFTLTFLAEWGDRSQIATIALAAAKEPFGVTLGACIGHALCTGLAVIGGKLLASRISERTVLLSGGSLFVVFFLVSVIQGPAD
uniref:GDT1 family protein n=1 Tax=Chrysotila carterae TaxID=13221 RepID=A0A7S4C1J5_CHRCT